MMICPRCDSELENGTQLCPYCGIKFKYKNTTPQGAGSIGKCKKATSCTLAYVLGAFGVHNFYLGYVVKGFIKLLISLLCIGTFAVPQLIYLSKNGTLNFASDAMNIFGFCTLPLFIAVWVWSVAELFQILLGKAATDASGQALQ